MQWQSLSLRGIPILFGMTGRLWLEAEAPLRLLRFKGWARWAAKPLGPIQELHQDDHKEPLLMEAGVWCLCCARLDLGSVVLLEVKIHVKTNSNNSNHSQLKINYGYGPCITHLIPDL